MQITNIKVFPPIGIARLGNSLTDFFIGPEIPGVIPQPPGGYKDEQCRIKRQAARFRLFGYNGNTLVREITAQEATISWQVHLVHGKSANYANDPNRKIDPGVKTITGSLKQAKLDTGTFGHDNFPPVAVDLGEIRTDNQGRLLVLGGFGNSGTADPSQANIILDFKENPAWYDDTADGSVNATVTINGNSIPVLGAWVIVGPPDFSPEIGNAISLYDRLKQYHNDNNLLPTGFALPTDASYQPSYNKDIYPLLKRGWVDVQEVLDVASPFNLDFNLLADNSSANQAARSTVMQGLRRNGGPVPRSSIEGEFQDLTPLQYSMLQKWEAGNFINDWTGTYIPENDITPEGLAKAALDNATGAVFYPGIEAGNQLVTNPTYYMAGELMRINQNNVNPGGLTLDMAVPWQADFYACRYTASGSTCPQWIDSAWWPTQRPIKALNANTNMKEEWHGSVNSYLDMVNQWHTLGFVVNSPTEGRFQFSERCDTASITLLTPSLNFGTVSLGPGNLPRQVAQAVVFEVVAPSSALTFEIDNHPAPINVQVLTTDPYSVGPTGNTSTQLLIPIRYTASNEGESVNTSVTIRNVQTNRTWTIPITGSTGNAKKNAIALVLDRSGSMKQDRGDGISKIQSLQDAVKIFVDLMADGDAAALIRYNEDAQEVFPLTEIGGSNINAASNLKNAVDGSDFNPDGWTSIGDGIIQGRTTLNNTTGFDSKSMIILTDGKENRDAYIDDVAAQVNEQTFAIGLGKPSNVNVSTLQRLTGNNGGYLLITGDALAGNNQFKLQKHFMQILTGINNKEIIYDPDGIIHPGQIHKVPFLISDAEIGVDVILLTPNTKHLQLSLQGPSGQIHNIQELTALSNVKHVVSSKMIYYRFSLPLEVVKNRFEYIGQWHAVITYSDQIAHGERPIPYSLNVHAYADLQFHLTGNACASNSNTFLLSGALQQYGSIPIMNASVWAEILAPNGHTSRQELKKNGQGQYRLQYNNCSPGLYTFRVIAHGKTLQGIPFSREKTLNYTVITGTEFNDTDGSWETQLPDPTDDYLVYGTIADADNRPIDNLIVKAVDQDFTGENPLGEATQTNSKGQYRIPYRGKDFIIEGKETGGADIIIYVYNQENELLYRAEPRRNSPKVKKINLVLPNFN